MKERYYKREIEDVVTESARQFPSVIVTGPRQSGKTTLLRHMFSKTHHYVSMDNPDLRVLAIRDPGLFFQNHPPPLIIDEIQYTPELFSYIKIAIDSNRSKGRFILTGSQIFPLMANVGESLAGRIAVFTLLPFSMKELPGIRDSTLNLRELQKMALTGGFPGVALNRNINRRLWFSSYFQTYLERDVRQIRQIGDLTDFQRLLQLLAANNGQVLNLSIMSRELGVAVNTVKSWVSILEASGQITILKPYYTNKPKRVIKSPKIYFLDTGLLCYLLEITSNEQVFKGPFAGQMLETMVLGELTKYYLNNGAAPRIYWWKTSEGHEVDFIVESRGRLIPIEVKMSSRINTEMVKNLAIFSGYFADKVGPKYVVNLAAEKVNLHGSTLCLPMNDFIKEIDSIIAL